jgi:lipid II:glycine glycyltransferase (peptidoglycan interpeptide bridge formation enzyme)
VHPDALQVRQTDTERLSPTSILFQSGLWARFRSERGEIVRAFDLGGNQAQMTVEVLDRGEFSLAYVPAGPSVPVAEDEQGRFLEELSAQVQDKLPDACVAIRYDLPWPSPYWGSPPPARTREIRMNFGTDTHQLQKAPTDLLAPDTVEIDLRATEERLILQMRPKTRYNIRLAERRGVRVRHEPASRLAEWHHLYRKTAERKGFRPQSLGYFTTLLDLAEAAHPTVRLYMAYHQTQPVGGIVVAHTGSRATYLYGASDYNCRSLMAPYALQWTAMRNARRAGCRRYDLFGVPPAVEAGHPMHGLYRFKTGFGGTLVHRRGAWDYVYREREYQLYQAAESASSGYYVRT